MKFCILLGYKFINNLNFGINQCISGHVIPVQKHGIYKTGHISAISKDRDFWFGLKHSLNLKAEHFTMFGVIKCISVHMPGHQLFFFQRISWNEITANACNL